MSTSDKFLLGGAVARVGGMALLLSCIPWWQAKVALGMLWTVAGLLIQYLGRQVED